VEDTPPGIVALDERLQSGFRNRQGQLDPSKHGEIKQLLFAERYDKNVVFGAIKDQIGFL